MDLKAVWVRGRVRGRGRGRGRVRIRGRVRGRCPPGGTASGHQSDTSEGARP